MPQPEPNPSSASTSSPLRLLFSTAIVVLLSGALIAGANVRDWVDQNRGRVSADSTSGIVASTQRDAGGVDLDAYYHDVEDILKDHYVEPITDETKLAVGAVHGMVASLGDPRSQYMDKDAFSAYLDAQAGHFRGIGVDFRFQQLPYDLASGDETASDSDPTGDVADARIPRLVVNSVVPGGPADRAGVKPGDWVDTVDGHWVLDSEVIAKYRKLVADENAAAKAGKLAPAKSEPLRRELAAKADASIMPIRAFADLALGKTGTVVVAWRRGNDPVRETKIEKSETNSAGNTTDASGVVHLRFSKDAGAFLKSAVAGKKAITIDLRGQPPGYYLAMVDCLKDVAPAGQYGGFKTLRKGEHLSPLTLESGNRAAPKLTLFVDGDVRGPAAIFALALSSRGLAKLKGGEVSDDRSRTDVEFLPDGSGYTLVTGDYIVAPGGRA
jgi:carboxyl-terminal processing protease